MSRFELTAADYRMTGISLTGHPMRHLRALLWLCELKDGDVTGRETPVGILPTREELRLEGLEISEEDLATILDIDVERWCQEMGFREGHLREFEGLPDAIWEAHRRVAAALDAARGA